MSGVKNPFIGVIVFLTSTHSISVCFSFLVDENNGIYQLLKAPQNPVETLHESTLLQMTYRSHVIKNNFMYFL